MAKKSRAARAEAREKDKRQKHVSRYRRILDAYGVDHYLRDGTDKAWHHFDNMMIEIAKLNVKVLQTMLLHLRSAGAVHPWYGEYHRALQSRVETIILEKTILK